MTALDTATMQELGIGVVQPAVETPATVEAPVVVPTTPVVETPVTSTEAPAVTPVEQPTTPLTTEYEIDGIGKVTPEQIKEWHSAGLRQSDYTKKTQEIARQKEELREAQELFEYLKANPHLVKQLEDAEGRPVDRTVVNTVTPEHQMVKEVYFNQMSMQIDKQLGDIKDKYKVDTIDEVSLFNKAREMGTNDLDFVYRALNFNTGTVDERALIEKAKEELRKEFAQTKGTVQTIVTSPSGNPIMTTGTLTEQEKRVAAGMNVSEADYLKWRDS